MKYLSFATSQDIINLRQRRYQSGSFTKKAVRKNNNLKIPSEI